ncbi:MAG: 1-acyl-sn-glycerol-3-phosphate acyltransferase [Planctomycetaceae bacterium]
MHDHASDAVGPPAASADSTPPGATGGGFAALLAVRALTVVDDNLLRWLAIGLGKHAAGAAGTALVLTVGTAGFVLPFVALAWLAGWLADRHSKRSVVAWCKFAEVLIVAAALAVLWWGGRPGGAFAGWSRLGAAAAALLGIAGAGWIASLGMPRRLAADPAAPPPFNALSRTLADLADIRRSPALLATAAGIVFFWALGAVAQLNVDQLVAEGGATAQSQAVPMLLALVVGIAVGSVVAGRISSRGADLGLVPLGALVMAGSSLALAVGPRAIFADGEPLAGAWWATAAALGALGFGAGIFDVPLEAHFQAVAPPARRGALLAALNLLTFTGMLGASLAYGLLRAPADQPTAPLPPALWLLLGTVILIGCQAALLAPALIGSIAEAVPPRRLADANGTFAMVTLAATLAGMAAGNWLADQPPPDATVSAAASPLVSARGVFGIFAALSLAAAFVAVWAAPRPALRLLVSAIVNSIWRLQVRDEARVPTAGPVVMIANHVSYLDGFLMPMTCHRLVRMVVYAPNIPGKFLRGLADQWRFIYFNPWPKSVANALHAMQHGLAEGDVIGIFCEGGISRHGQVLGFKRGLERILDKVASPLEPVHIDGLWGSTLSFAGGQFFGKRPRRFRSGGPRGLRRTVTLTYGPLLAAGTPPAAARLALQELSATAIRRRLAEAAPAATDGVDPVAVAATLEAFDGCCLLRRGDRIVASLAPGDPLHAALGTPAALGMLVGTARVVDAATAAGELARLLAAERATVWIARVGQVAALAAEPGAAALGSHVSAVVMPIASVGELAPARAAATAFLAAAGVEPVVAYAPREAGGLVAMNTPPARAGVDHEVTCRPDTLGRVVNGVAVWPEAALRIRLGLESLAAAGVPDDSPRSLVIGATLPRGPGADRAVPGAVPLADTCRIDDEGFLVPGDTEAGAQGRATR